MENSKEIVSHSCNSSSISLYQTQINCLLFIALVEKVTMILEDTKTVFQIQILITC